ncbi:haloacid dehalogenase type II [Sneathiella chungangensis]|uniref:(S)-2-haloacid dehalogenase n=1 Tax=Sneathiella chungangensis TaxID=1418234 RepID=A0A845MBZ6_9PROT|nr:haloacid dehalogenase type II [Sneathiella chungangensis]MZR21232.1 haloacid dehalogenase type II [Sneathiella chungangensis]
MATVKLEHIKACVFDAYGTLFDVNAAARAEQQALGDKWQEIAEIWRMKQLQYTWLRSLQRRHADFWEVTGDALDFAIASAKMADPALRERLMNLYLTLSAYPEVKATLQTLKRAGMKCAILSNGTPEMLDAAVENAGIASLLDGIYSIEEVGIYKPDPSVYQLAVDRLDVSPSEISFQSSNGWDAYSAKAFGFNVIWCNRFGQADERLPETPDAQIRTLDELPAIVGAV